MCQQYKDGINCTCRKWYWRKRNLTLKELWKALKPLGLSSVKASRWKISLKKCGVIHVEALENANTFKMLYSELAGGLQEKLLKAPNKFTRQTTKNFCAKSSWDVFNDFQFSNVSGEVLKRFYLTSIPVKPLEWIKFQQNFWGKALKYWLFLWEI